MKQLYPVFAAALLVITAGCSTSLITSSWVAPSATAKPYKKLLVLGMINEPDRTVREMMEQHVVNDLRTLGYTAVCACEEYGPKAFEGMTEKEAVLRLDNQGFDAVITIVLLNKAKEKYYNPGRTYPPSGPGYQHRFWGYYSAMYNRVYDPQYYTTATRYFWESNLYDLADRSLVYSVQSQSFDPASARSLGHEYGAMLVKDMVKQKVLQQVPPTLKSF